MHLLIDKDNPLTESNSEKQAELHIARDEMITVVFPNGDELYIDGKGTGYDLYGNVIYGTES